MQKYLNIFCEDTPPEMFDSIAKNTVISPNFLVWKLCGKAQFPHSFGSIAWNYAETVLFHKIFTPRNKMKFRYFSKCRLLMRLSWIFWSLTFIRILPLTTNSCIIFALGIFIQIYYFETATLMDENSLLFWFCLVNINNKS